MNRPHFDYVEAIPKPQVLYPLPKREWDRIKEDIKKCKPKWNWSKDALLLFIGIFVTAFFSLIAFKNTSQVKTWVLNTNIIVLIITFILIIVFFVIHLSNTTQQNASIDDILTEMSAIEKHYDIPSI